MIDYTNINWEPFFSAYENDTVVKAIVGEVSGNGHRVFVMGVPAYLPKSQKIPDMELTTGGDVDVCIIKIMPETNNVVVSARVAAEIKARSEARDLQVGDIVPVRVKNIVSFGVFVSILGCPDGLIFLKELSYQSIHSADEVVSLGDEFNAKVIKISKKDGKTRFELSLKQLLPDPWESFPHSVGDIVEGEVSALVDYGAFLNIASVTGILHRSELSWTKMEVPLREMLSIGDKIKVMIISLDKENKKMALSLREVEGDPWQKLEHTEGDVVEGRILNKTSIGLFVGLESNIEGLLHKNDLAWFSDDQKALLETLKVGDMIRAVIISIDRVKKKLGLSMKLLHPHPYDTFVAEHPSGTTFDATILRNNVPGTMHVALPIGKFQIFFDPILRRSWNEIIERYPVSGTIPIKTRSYDPEAKKIEFSPAI